jgi:phosphoribosylformylglycinamidine (FGAM) synthase PurS component
MKASIRVTLKTGSAEDAQQFLRMVCAGLMASGSIEDYRFEIEADKGVVTERCVLSEGGVIA